MSKSKSRAAQAMGATRLGEPSAKRRKANPFGGVDDDIPTPLSQATAPTASALSTRSVPGDHVPSLGTLCAKVFADNLQRLSGNQSTWEDVRWRLKQLPDNLVPKLFYMLRQTCPTLLQHGFLVAVGLKIVRDVKRC